MNHECLSLTYEYLQAHMCFVLGMSHVHLRATCLEFSCLALALTGESASAVWLRAKHVIAIPHDHVFRPGNRLNPNDDNTVQ